MNQTPLKVSICCAYYNRAPYLRATIDSLLAQDHDSFEVVIVNDGSSDPQVREILDSYCDPRLIVFHQENFGFVSAIRRAIRESRGEYIAIQGAGDLSRPSRIAKQALILENEPDVGIVGCRQSELYVGGNFDGKERLSHFTTSHPTMEEMAGRDNPISHGEVMYRRTIYDKVGGYRSLFTYAQDRDLFLRMGQYCKIRAVEDILYDRRHFRLDGVNSNGEKAVLQRIMSQFAVQCYRDRIEYGKDLVDEYGCLGIVFRNRHSRVAKTAAERSIEILLRGNSRASLRCAYLAFNERRTPRTIMALILSTLGSRSENIVKLLKRLNTLRILRLNKLAISHVKQVAEQSAERIRS